MTPDEALNEAEATWRQAALEGRKQFNADLPDSAGATCAALILKDYGGALGALPKGWRCPLCAVSYPGFRLVATALVHLNNHHHWDWLTFAEKFRDVLAEGECLSHE